jgi:hypothetical protein
MLYRKCVSIGGVNTIYLTPSGGPVPNQHTMYSNSTELDDLVAFPVNCPNGSGHSIKLGNNTGGGQAEGFSYEFTIPADRMFIHLFIITQSFSRILTTKFFSNQD